LNQNLDVNPYIAGSVVTGEEMFFGRDDVFSFVRRNLMGLHRDAPIVLYGQRRTGKTSVLYHLPRHLDPRYRCVLVDLHGLIWDGGMGGLMWGIASLVSRGLRRDHQITVAVPARATFLADPRSAFENVFLDAVWSALGGDHLVLMVDEVARLEEEVAAGRIERDVFDYLRHLMQHYDGLNFIFALGSGLEELEKEYAFLFNASLYHRISFLEPAAAHSLISNPANGRYEVDPAAAAKILQITSGHPYYTQLVCHSIFDRWIRDPKPVMTTDDVTAVLAEAIELGSANLTFVWDDSTPEEKAIMAGMASVLRAGGRRVTVERVREAWRQAGVLMPAGSAARAVRGLTAREVIIGERGYSFTVDLQRLWIRKHRRLDWVKEDLTPVAADWQRAAKAEFDARIMAEPLTKLPRGTGGAFHTVPELTRLYDFPADLDGTGQCVGLIELGGGYLESDIEAYMRNAGLGVPRITSVSVDGAVNSPGSPADAVVVLNIETVAAAAPGARIVVYFAPNTDRGFTDAITTAVADDVNNPSVLCIAWGTPESSWTDETITAIDRALAKAAARGITVCCAAGDGGPTDGVLGNEPHVDFPASSPYALACGGTRISVTAGRIDEEVVWNDLARHAGGTGGGFSRRFAVPDWQAGDPASMTRAATSGRGLPDVAINASPNSGYQVLLDGQSTVVGGTSAVVGLWAGLIARLNQGLGERVGFLNPVLYRNLGPAGVLRDITEGSTKLGDGSEVGFDARPGWDPCTGWGSPNGERLLAALRLLQTTRPPRDERPAG
jgi:hypothetical protein